MLWKGSRGGWRALICDLFFPAGGGHDPDVKGGDAKGFSHHLAFGSDGFDEPGKGNEF